MYFSKWTVLYSSVCNHASDTVLREYVMDKMRQFCHGLFILSTDIYPQPGKRLT